MKFLGSFALLFFAASARALIGGHPVEEGDALARSVVALQMVEELTGERNLYKGSAVIVGPDLLLTAAHNFFYLQDPTASEAIFAARPAWGTANQGQTRIKVKEAILLPGFTQGGEGTGNDLALVRLAEKIPEGYTPLEMDFSPLAEGEELLLAGYGRSVKDANPPLGDYRLRSLPLPFARTTPQKIWFTNSAGSIAGGDSGGPALVERGGAYRVRGIAIHGRYDECVARGECESQSAFTDLATFREWLNAHVP